MDDMRWVTADGGAMDRVVVLCAVLLGLCAATMVAVTFSREAWVGLVFWAAVLLGCGVVGWRVRRRIRRVSRPGSS